jgi:hypothetical protein
LAACGAGPLASAPAKPISSAQSKAGANGGVRGRLQYPMNVLIVIAGFSGLGVFCMMALKSLLSSR